MKSSFLSGLGMAACALLGLLNGEGLPASSPSGEAASGAKTRFAGWNIEYNLPPGWQVKQSQGRVQVLGSNNDPGAIFLGAGTYQTPGESIADLSLFYQSLNLQAFPMEPPQNTTIADLKGVVAVYASRDQMGRTIQGRFISLFTPHGTGLNMLAMTTPDQMQGLRSVLERLAASVTAQAPSVNQQAIQALAGNWVLYQGGYQGGSSSTGTTSHSHEESVVFDGRGNYRWQSSTSVSVSTPGYTGDAGRATGDADQGTYSVIGTALVMKGTKGQFVFDFQLEGQKLIAGGKTYLRN